MSAFFFFKPFLNVFRHARRLVRAPARMSAGKWEKGLCSARDVFCPPQKNVTPRLRHRKTTHSVIKKVFKRFSQSLV